MKILQKLIATSLIALLSLTSIVQAAETVTYFHNDLLGSPAAATDESGEVIWRENYQAFGEKVKNQDEKTGNVIGYTGHVHDKDTGLTYMQARYYDPVIGRFYANDPVGFLEQVQRGNSPAHGFNRYAYANNNPYKFVDPDGNSPISYLAKQAAKHGIEKGLKKMTDRQLRRLGRYMNETQKKEFLSDAADILSSLDSSPAEIAVEAIPVLGDIYGGVKFGKGISSAYSKAQDLENKWIDKILASLPPEQRKKFITAMRNAGVRDAKQDQGIPKTGSGMEMHHNDQVKDFPERASDPRHIEALSPDDHKERHRN